jgi:hypothetical protein
MANELTRLPEPWKVVKHDCFQVLTPQDRRGHPGRLPTGAACISPATGHVRKLSRRREAETIANALMKLRQCFFEPQGSP